MLLGVVLAVLAAAPASAPADDSLVRKSLRDCGHSEGPLPLRVLAGKQEKAALAIACTKKGTTTLKVFALSSSGLYAAHCDKKAIPGVATRLTLVKAPRPLIYLVTRAHTPEVERVIESAIEPTWGACATLATTDLKHPADEDAVLREPRAGLVFNDKGAVAWDNIVRFDFQLSVSERRKVAMGMRGKEIPFDAQATPAEIEEMESFLPVALLAAAIVRPNKAAEILAVVDGQLQSQPSLAAGEQLELDFAKAPVRGVRVRFRQGAAAFTVGAAEIAATLRPKMAWSKAPGIFGAGLIASSEAARTSDGVMFLQPAIELQKVTIKATGPVHLFEIIPFSDAPDWEPFEPSEDFGEHD